MSVTAVLARRLAVAALVLAAIGAVMIAGLVAAANGSTAPAPAPAPVPVPVAAVQPAAAPAIDPLLADLMPGTEVSPERAEALLIGADLVCEWFTAEVPVTEVEVALAAQVGITLPEAHDFVALASTTHCAAPVAVASAPVPVAPTAVASAPRRSPAPVAAEAPLAPAPVAAVQPAPVTEEPVAEQSPEEAIGGARCDNPEQVVVAIDDDGEYVCGDA